MEILLKKNGADRVSNDAKNILKTIIEAKAEEIARTAVELSEHAGRRTVKKQDVMLAAKKYMD